MILITGNTFPVKDQIKALGGRWNADAKGWMVPADKADQAKALVAGGANGGSANATTSYSRPKVCKVCGVKESFERGYGGRMFPRIKIYRSGECQDCYEERKMGY